MFRLGNIAVIILVGVIIRQYCQYSSPPNLNSSVNGGTVKKLEWVKKDFKTILENEREGLALAVYVGDQLVVDLWGGYSDSTADKSWTKDTMTCVYSVSKVFGSLVVAALVSQGKLHYDDLVVKHWPEYGQMGKEKTTVHDLIAHRAGLIGFGEDIPIEKAYDLDFISKIIEKSKPHWEPGTAYGYHAFTIGFLIDQLVRRVDTKNRTTAEFYSEEIVGELSEKFYIGLPREKFHLVARNTNPSQSALLRDKLKDPWAYIQNLFTGDEMLKTILTSVKHLSILGELIRYNDPDVLATPNAASTGVGTARGLAQASLQFFKRAHISAAQQKLLHTPLSEAKDVVCPLDLYRGHGFMYSPHPLNENKWILSGFGYGEQYLAIDTENRISIALIRNGLKPVWSEMEEFFGLRDRIIKSVLGK